VGVRARDTLSGNELDIRARVILNAAGPWVSQFLERFGLPGRGPLLTAMNVVTTRPARSAALVAAARGGRSLVMLPWRGRTLIGTSESTVPGDPAADGVDQAELARFLGEINETFPLLRLRVDEISLVHRGVVPAIPVNGRLSLMGHSRILDHAAEGVGSLMSIVGVKYTTARAVAERALDLVLRKLGRPPGPCRTASTKLPGAAVEDQPSLALATRVERAVKEEMAQTLDDVVRRIGLAALGPPDPAQLSQCARLINGIRGR
jgi:glycerol-3-phosphate dehydrogenase